MKLEYSTSTSARLIARSGGLWWGHVVLFAGAILLAAVVILGRSDRSTLIMPLFMIGWVLYDLSRRWRHERQFRIDAANGRFVVQVRERGKVVAEQHFDLSAVRAIEVERDEKYEGRIVALMVDGRKVPLHDSFSENQWDFKAGRIDAVVRAARSEMKNKSSSQAGDKASNSVT